jgi:hypothetical protein
MFINPPASEKMGKWRKCLTDGTKLLKLFPAQLPCVARDRAPLRRRLHFFMFYGYGVFCAVERDPEYFEIATSRIAVASPLPPENG